MSKPNIVILEGYTVDPGDLSWDALKSVGNVAIYDRTAPDQIAERAGDADIIISSKIIWSADNLKLVPKCKMIQLQSTGYNVVDFDAAKAQGITVCNVPAYSTPDVAQHTFALILETTNHVGEYSASVREGDWVKSQDFCYYLDPLMELSEKTLGIIGMGSIGSAVASIAMAFGMKVLFENPHPKPQLENENCKQVELDELLANSDIVTLHCPATPSDKGMVNKDFLVKMKHGARLIDTARGTLIDSQAVADALESGQLSWYAADVAEHEPMLADDPLRTAKHAIITPHVAWATKEARERLLNACIENVKLFLEGKPRDVVPPAQ